MSGLNPIAVEAAVYFAAPTRERRKAAEKTFGTGDLRTILRAAAPDKESYMRGQGMYEAIEEADRLYGPALEAALRVITPGERRRRRAYERYEQGQPLSAVLRAAASTPESYTRARDAYYGALLVVAFNTKPGIKQRVGGIGSIFRNAFRDQQFASRQLPQRRH